MGSLDANSERGLSIQDGFFREYPWDQYLPREGKEASVGRAVRPMASFAAPMRRSEARMALQSCSQLGGKIARRL